MKKLLLSLLVALLPLMPAAQAASINDLTATTTSSGSDYYILWQSGLTRKLAFTDLVTAIFAATPDSSVPFSKLPNVASGTLLGRWNAGTGNVETATLNSTLSFSGSGALQRAALSGDVTATAGSNATTIANSAVTYAKIQNVSATDRLLGRATAGAGVIEEIPLTATGRSIIASANTAGAQSALSLVPGTNVQTQNANLQAISGLTSAADTVPYFTGAGSAATQTFTTFGRSLVATGNASSARTTLGLGTNATASVYPTSIQVAVSDETSNLTTGTAKITFRMPYLMTFTGVRISSNTAPTGAAITVNVKEAGVTLFSTKPTIAAGSTTSVGGTAAVISDSSLADDAVITVDIDTVGSTTPGTGLKLTLLGTRN